MFWHKCMFSTIINKKENSISTGALYLNCISVNLWLSNWAANYLMCHKARKKEGGGGVIEQSEAGWNEVSTELTLQWAFQVDLEMVIWNRAWPIAEGGWNLFKAAICPKQQIISSLSHYESVITRAVNWHQLIGHTQSKPISVTQALQDNTWQWHKNETWSIQLCNKRKSVIHR